MAVHVHVVVLSGIPGMWEGIARVADHTADFSRLVRMAVLTCAGELKSLKFTLSGHLLSVKERHSVCLWYLTRVQLKLELQSTYMTY